MSPAAAPANLNDVWAHLLVEELCRQGVTCFVLTPGSRSALLALAARKLGAQCLVHWDERAVGFYALGHARATGQPAVVITTSGTAVANLMPAVVEASADSVPMIVISADRPPELRDTGANQTIDQTHLFGRYVRWFHELGPADASVPVQAVLTAADHAVARALGEPGPVHINMLFREPLTPTVVDAEAPQAWASLADWLIRTEPYTRIDGTEYRLAEEARDRLARLFDPQRRGVVVIGGGADPAAAAAALEIARACSWPVLADVRSHARFTEHPSVMAYADQILLSEFWMDHLKADCVFQVGPRITSKRMLRYLKRAKPSEWVLVKMTPNRMDEAHRVTWAVQASGKDLQAVGATLSPSPKSKWLSTWQDANHLVGGAIDKFLAVLPELNEAVLVRELTRHIPKDHALFVGNSMPIRDLDMLGVPGWGGRPVANRGASGIDGIIATAVGYAGGSKAPLTCLLGDTSLLHDLTSLRLAARTSRAICINVLNNNGGGIFHFLPVSETPEHFEEIFGAPHGLNFKSIATWLEIPYAVVETLPDWVRAYKKSLDRGGPSLIEIVTDRRENLNVHRALEQKIINALDDMAPYQDTSNIL
ncbi:MAG: 2-succinyl-5-enolpyruvyl-6-hydroxy-3-cyclohexene-1-carboxylic-acid synthase [Kiritimatiellae bacterium]|nr:2-succinyl-5-enolpyruvyl-6-hydroxy-3-cyclohexene-1-carboxylic-acid synthase [Kiritimatiellia bacterium]